MTAGGKRKPRYGFGDIVMLTACHGPAEAANLTVPSNLISCSHSGPSGGSPTSLVSCGFIQAGSAIASVRGLPASDRVMPASGAIARTGFAPLHFCGLSGNRFDQARVVVLDVSDPRAHRPAGHLL